MKRQEQLEGVIAPVISGLGYEFVGMEYIPQPRHSVVRIYIDQEKGISIGDCEKVTRQVGAALDVEEDLLRGAYNLEVSSPGLDRKLFKLEQYGRFIGQQVRVTLRVPVDGQKNFSGRLFGVDGERVGIEFSGKEIWFEYIDIAQAQIVEERSRM